MRSSCKTRGPSSLISCLWPRHVSLDHRGAFWLNGNGGCSFDDDWVCPPAFGAVQVPQKANAMLVIAVETFSHYRSVRSRIGRQAVLLLFQSEWALSQFRVVAPFLWCQKLHSWSETTESTVWTWLGRRVQRCLVQNPSICLDLNETLRSHQTFLEWVNHRSASSGHRNDRAEESNYWQTLKAVKRSMS